MLYGIAAAVTALLLTTTLTALVRRFALRVGLVDRPSGRKAHVRPTPYLGGPAVVTGTAVVSGTGAWTGLTPLGSDAGTLLLVALAVAVLGLLDDLRPMGARIRVVVETVAATLIVRQAELDLFTGLLAAMWIVFITNAFNLLDNSDGAMGMVAVVTVLGLSVCAAAEESYGLTVLLSVLAAALTGFLMHNWHPARIFLGDCGSLFTGFLLSAAAVLVHSGHAPLPSAGGLFALTAVATADTVLVLVSRRRAGRPVLQGGTDHIAHRLRRLGFTPQGAAVVLGIAAFGGTLVGLLLHRGAVGALAVVWVVAAVVVAVLLLLRVPVYGVRRRADQRQTAAAGSTAVDLAGG